MRNYYLNKDVGQIFARNKYIEKAISVTKNEIDLADTTKINFVLGKFDALVDGKGKLHKKLIEEIVETKQKISVVEDEGDILNEISYLNGYIAGIEEILNCDRKIFEINNSFVLYLYSVSEELILKYKLALSVSDFFTDSNEKNKIRYIISTKADEICEKIYNLGENTEFAICVIYDKENQPSKEILQQLSFERNMNVYLLHDNGSAKYSVDHIIKNVLRSTIV